MTRSPDLGDVEFREGTRRKTAVAIVAVTLALVIVLGVWAWVVFVFQPYGQRQWTLLAIGAALGAATVGIRLKQRLSIDKPASVERLFGRSFGRLGRCVLWGTLTCWLGLIAWSAISPGGTLPPPKLDPAAIRVLTWNILHGNDRGLPWTQYGWRVRKRAIAAVLAATKPDIVCVQEALEEQGKYLAELLPGYRREGVGRDDGRSAGEHCSIFFDRTRFDELGGGTFWLEEPADRPAAEFRLSPKRICTWVRLRDCQTGLVFRVYNTHQYLTEEARVQAVRLILARIDLGDPSDAVLVTGDFNAPPEARDRRLFEAVGIVSTAIRERFARISNLPVLWNPPAQPR